MKLIQILNEANNNGTIRADALAARKQIMPIIKKHLEGENFKITGHINKITHTDALWKTKEPFIGVDIRMSATTGKESAGVDSKHTKAQRREIVAAVNELAKDLNNKLSLIFDLSSKPRKTKNNGKKLAGGGSRDVETMFKTKKYTIVWFEKDDGIGWGRPELYLKIPFQK